MNINEYIFYKVLPFYCKMIQKWPQLQTFLFIRSAIILMIRNWIWILWLKIKMYFFMCMETLSLSIFLSVSLFPAIALASIFKSYTNWNEIIVHISFLINIKISLLKTQQNISEQQPPAVWKIIFHYSIYLQTQPLMINDYVLILPRRSDFFLAK